MAGTVQGGKNAADTNYLKYGNDFYKKIGALGGKEGHTGGFYVNRELAAEMGRKYGRLTKRGKNVVKKTVE